MMTLSPCERISANVTVRALYPLLLLLSQETRLYHQQRYVLATAPRSCPFRPVWVTPSSR